jgi:hypothetical protein
MFHKTVFTNKRPFQALLTLTLHKYIILYTNKFLPIIFQRLQVEIKNLRDKDYVCSYMYIYITFIIFN